jgi:fluoroquinolone resistance protein
VGTQGTSIPNPDLDSSTEFFDQTFRGLVRDGQSIRGKQFDTCRFESCSFQAAELVDCVFGDTTLVGCNLSVAKLTNSRLAEVKFSRSKATGVDWTLAQWSRVGAPIVFEDECVLDYSVFLGLKLKRAVFRDCSLHEVDFTEADLSESDFSGSDLSGARFNHTNLTKAQLEGAFGYSIDPINNKLKGARVSLPEAGSLIRSLGIKIVDAPQGSRTSS